MSEVWKPQPFEVLKQWVDAIMEEASDELNDWESTFIADISVKIYNGWQLTKAQHDKLEQIYAEKTK